MLDEKDLAAIAQLMANQEMRILESMDTKMSRQKAEILGEMDKQKTEILEQSAANMRVLIESYVAPQFNLLSEKIDSMSEKLAPMEAVQDHDDRLDDLESVVRRHTREIEALKKAQ